MYLRDIYIFYVGLFMEFSKNKLAHVTDSFSAYKQSAIMLLRLTVCSHQERTELFARVNYVQSQRKNSNRGELVWCDVANWAA